MALVTFCKIRPLVGAKQIDKGEALRVLDKQFRKLPSGFLLPTIGGLDALRQPPYRAVDSYAPTLAGQRPSFVSQVRATFALRNRLRRAVSRNKDRHVGSSSCLILARNKHNTLFRFPPKSLPFYTT